MLKPISKFGFLRRHRLMTAATLLIGLATASGAIASTQPFASDNPFESSIPGASSDNGIAAGEPAIGEIIPSFPGLPTGGFPSTPGSAGGSLENIIVGGVGNILGTPVPGVVPKIFKDILNGSMGGLLESLLGVLTSQNKIFEEVSKVVLGDGWEEIDSDGNANTPPDPYRVRMPQPEDAEKTGPLTRSEIVLRRDQANHYDQELGRAMAAPMLAEKGDEWLSANIATSSDMMQAGLVSTQSAVAKAGEATKATSTQDIVRKSAEMSGIAATLQMQEMQQNAMLGESLWNMQRLESAQLQLAANASEAADEQNRRDRASRTASLASAAAEAMIIPGLANLSNAASEPVKAPEAKSIFAE